MRKRHHSVKCVRRRSSTRTLLPVILATCLSPDAAAAQSAAELEAWMHQALEAAAQALAAEEGRLNELAAQNSHSTLSDGVPSSARAAASIRLWNNDIREQEAKEGQLFARLEDEMKRLVAYDATVKCAFR